MILQGQAARDYINRNPTSNYRVLSGTPNQEQRVLGEGMLGGLLRGMFLEPFARVGEGLSSATFGALQNATGDMNTRYDPMWRNVLGSDLSEEVISDPIQQGVVKGGAGIASMLLGSGGIPSSIGKAIGTGALTGGLGSFGASRQGEGLQAALTGAAIGAPIGALGYGLSKLGSGSTQAAVEEVGIQASPTMRYGLGEEVPNFQSTVVNDISNTIGEFNPSLGVSDDITTNVAGQSSGVIESPLLTTLKEQRAGLGQGGSSVDDILPISDRNIRRLGLSPSESTNLRNELIGDMKSAGFNTSSATDLSNNYGDYISSLADEKANLLSQIGGDVVESDKVSSGLKKMADILGDNGSDVKLINDRLSEIFGRKVTVKTVPTSMTKAQVVAVKELADDIAGGFEKVMAADTTSQVSNKLLSSVRNASRDVASGDKLLDNYLQKASRAAKLRDIVVEAPSIATKISDKSTSVLGRLDQQIAKEQMRMAKESRLLADANDIGIKIPFTDTAIPTGIDRTNVFSGISNISSGISNRLKNIGSSVSNVISGIAPTAASTSPYIPRIAGIMSQYQPQGGGQELGSSGQPLGSQAQQEPITGSQILSYLDSAIAEREAQRSQEFINLVNSGMSTTDAKRIVDMQLPQLKKPSLTDKESSAIQALDLLAEYESTLSGGGMFASSLPFGGFNSQGQQLKSAREAMVELFGRMQSGAVISPSEESRFRSLLPSITDTPETVRYNLDQMRQMLMSKLGNVQLQTGTSLSDEYGNY